MDYYRIFLWISYALFASGFLLTLTFIILSFRTGLFSTFLSGKKISVTDIHSHNHQTRKQKILVAWASRLMALSLIAFFVAIYLNNR